MKKFKLMLVAIMAMLGVDAFAQAGLTEGKEQTKDGIRFSVTSVYKTEAVGKTNTVKASLNGFSGATISIPADITFHVKGTDNDGVAIDDDVTFKVTAVGSFANLASATAISVGANVASIDAGAFIGTKIASLDLSGTKVTTIDRWFTDATTTTNASLLSVSLPACAQGVVGDAFKGCSGLATVTFADLADDADNLFTAGIGADAFYGTAITTLDLTKTKITTLNKLFEPANAKLKTVKLPASLVEIAPTAFQKCGVLSSVDFTLATKLKIIGNSAFDNTPSLTTLDLSKCAALLNFTTDGAAPGTDVTPFTAGGTSTNDYLTTLTLPETIVYIGTALKNCKALATVNIDKTAITGLVAGSLTGLDAITELVLPESCLNIAATGKTGLTSLTINGKGSATQALTLAAGAFAMADKECTITLAGISYWTALTAAAITGPTTKTSTVVVGDIASTADISAAKNLVSGTIKSFTIGAIAINKAKGFNVEFFGQAAKIVFNGNITTTGTGTTYMIAPTTANAPLTEIDFGTIAIDDIASLFPAIVFDETKAVKLANVSWNPATAPTNTVFNVAAFSASDGNRAKDVAFATSTATAAGLGALNDVNFTVPPTKVTVENNGTGDWYYAGFNPTGNVKIAAKQGDATVIVYAAYINTTEPTKVYHEQLRIIEGYYFIPAAATTGLIIKANAKIDVEVKSATVDATHNSMPYFPGAAEISHNDIKYVAGAKLGTEINALAGDTDHVVYALSKITKNNLAWKTVPATASATNWFYIVAPKKAAEIAADRLQNVWLDGSEPDDAATAIQTVKKVVEDGAIYNLQGVRVNAAYKGVVIKDGKKYIQK